ncbi:MAG: hypothetical protein CME21_15590 [Gemmatimonadetes bacterium]|nr:hypothetical protein [Gemmatimonadota bacterium]
MISLEFLVVGLEAGCLRRDGFRGVLTTGQNEEGLVQNSTDKVCELCGEVIPAARILAIADVRRCVACQEKVESGVNENTQFGDSEAREEVAPVEVDRGLIRKGSWSSNVMALSGTSAEIQTLISGGKEREASALVKHMPLEAQATVVAMNPDPEQILSLTAMGEDGKPRYNTDVVSLLPTETIAGMVAIRPDEKVYNSALVKAMSLQTFRRAVEETLDPIADQRLRGRVTWEWLEVVAAIDDPNRAADLLRVCDSELLEDALIDRMKAQDMNRTAGGVNVFRFFSSDGAGAVSPSHFVGGGNFGDVLNVLYDAAPDLIRLVIRRAWERSVEDDDEVIEKKEEETKDESSTEERPADEDEELSLWNTGE